MVFQQATVSLTTAAALQEQAAQRALPPHLDTTAVDIPQITSDGQPNANVRVQIVVNGYRVSW